MISVINRVILDDDTAGTHFRNDFTCLDQYLLISTHSQMTFALCPKDSALPSATPSKLAQSKHCGNSGGPALLIPHVNPPSPLLCVVLDLFCLTR